METLLVDQLLAPVVRVVVGMVVHQIHLLPLPLAQSIREAAAAVTLLRMPVLAAQAALAL